MPARKAFVLLVVLGGLFALMYYFVGVRGPVTAPSTDVGAVSRGLVAPAFELPDLTGRKVRLADYKDHIVLINYWATWCQPCLDEMPSLEKLYQQFRSRRLVVLAINVNETREDLSSYIQQAGLTFPILLEGQETAARYGTEKLPESYLLNERGVVIQKVIGARDWLDPEVVRYFDELLPR
jgi:thiol-disulfide isomerase/thioredoxin